MSYPFTLSPEAFSALRHEVSRRGRAHARAMRETKRCPVCSESKPLTEWGVNSARRDGLQAWCRECKNAYRPRVTPSETSPRQAAPVD